MIHAVRVAVVEHTIPVDLLKLLVLLYGRVKAFPATFYDIMLLFVTCRLVWC